MYRIKLDESGSYRNAELTETEFLDIVTGARPDLGIAIWNPETLAYVSNAGADAAVSLYTVCDRPNYP